MIDLGDGVVHDKQCEYASEACGCESRTALRQRIAELERQVQLKDAIYEHDIQAALDDPESFRENELAARAAEEEGK